MMKEVEQLQRNAESVSASQPVPMIAPTAQYNTHQRLLTLQVIQAYPAALSKSSKDLHAPPFAGLLASQGP